MMGNALVARLFYSLKKRNVPVLFGAALTELIGDAHGITGARLRQGDRDIVVTARKGVVLATGGFGHNKAFRAEVHAAARRRRIRSPAPPISATASRSASSSAPASRRSKAAAGCGRRSRSRAGATAPRGSIRTCRSTAPSPASWR